jgi:hypothetical protein
MPSSATRVTSPLVVGLRASCVKVLIGVTRTLRGSNRSMATELSATGVGADVSAVFVSSVNLLGFLPVVIVWQTNVYMPSLSLL